MMEVDLAGGGGVGLLKGRRRDAEDIPGLEPDKKRRKTLVSRLLGRNVGLIADIYFQAKKACEHYDPC